MASFTTVPSAGAKLRASVLSALIVETREIAAVKTADDTRTSTTYTADTHLTIAIPAAGTYDIECVLYYNGPTGGTNGRLKCRFNFPSGALSSEARTATLVWGTALCQWDGSPWCRVVASPQRARYGSPP